MDWIVYGLLSVCIFGFVQLVDKIVLSKFEVPPSAYLFMLGISSLGAAGFIYVLGISPTTGYYSGLAVLNGAIFFILVGGFFYTLSKVDTPVAAALFYLKVVFVALWGRFIFHEVFPAHRYVGIALIVAVAVALSFVGRAKGTRAVVSARTFGVVLFSTFLASVMNALAKYGLEAVDTKTWFFYERLGAIPALAVLLSVPTVRQAAMASVRRLQWNLALVFLSEFVGLSAVFFVLKSFSLGPLTIVAVLTSAIPLFTTTYILLINSIRPGTIPDSATHSHWMERSFLILVGLVGIYLAVM